MSAAALTGFFTGLSLILAIGAQNAFVLRQGLTRRHVGPVVALCALSDALLIAVGVAGFGTLAGAWPWFPRAMALAGAAFLAVYALTRFRAAWTGSSGLAATGATASLGATLATAAAFTWLNPHVWLDTVGLVGASSLQFHGAARLAFALGAMSASLAFFSSLGYGARLLAPLLTSARAWAVLDIGIGLTMLALAAKLLAG